MNQNIISQQERSANMEQSSSSQRRPSLWDKITAGYLHSSQADNQGIKKADASGFAPVGAKFDDGFGSSALWETTLNGPKHDPRRSRERNSLGEDALRQMS